LVRVPTILCSTEHFNEEEMKEINYEILGVKPRLEIKFSLIRNDEERILMYKEKIVANECKENE
jgi:hypothetical protein